MTTSIAKPTTEQYARDRLMAEIAEHGWPEPRLILFIAEQESGTGRPCLSAGMRSAADVHRAAALMGRTASVDYHVAQEPGETGPAGSWYASRLTCLRISRWLGGIDLQVSIYETISGGAR